MLVSHFKHQRTKKKKKHSERDFNPQAAKKNPRKLKHTSATFHFVTGADWKEYVGVKTSNNMLKKGGIMVVSLPKPIVTFVLTVYLFIRRTVTDAAVRRAVSRRQCCWFGLDSKTTSESARLRWMWSFRPRALLFSWCVMGGGEAITLSLPIPPLRSSLPPTRCSAH